MAAEEERGVQILEKGLRAPQPPPVSLYMRTAVSTAKGTATCGKWIYPGKHIMPFSFQNQDNFLRNLSHIAWGFYSIAPQRYLTFQEPWVEL